MLFLGEDKIARVSVVFDGSGASSGTDTSDATLTSGSQMLLDVSSYSKGKKYVGTIPTVEAPTPSIEVSSTGLITSTVVNPYGYQSSEIINADTKQLPTQEATTIIPSFSEQIAVESGVYTTEKIIVSAMPVGALKTPTIDTSTGIVTAGVTTSGYIGTSKTATLQLNTKSAETFTPTTSDQTIAFGQYLTGTQTIKGDANLIPGNIISGKSIFGVSGNVVIQKYYTGTTEPSSSLGNDGDIYLKA